MNPYDSLLPFVRRPSRYLGCELNVVRKDLRDVDTTVALVFPDKYEVGMSHLGLRILYEILNREPRVACERVFCPDTDYEALLRSRKLPLASLESKQPLGSFDIVGFSLQYELSYTNVLNALELGGIPLLSVERRSQDPLIIAGGPCATNPEPIADFIDAIVVGDGEDIVLEILSVYQRWKASGSDRDALLEALGELKGIYIPAFYEPTYNQNGTIGEVKPLKKGVGPVVKRDVMNLEKAVFPTRPIVPFASIVHDRISLETGRGCIWKCRFCQAGSIDWPVRERSISTLVQQAAEGLAASGYDELSLANLSIGDYSDLHGLVYAFMDRFAAEKVSVSLPSLRPATLSPALISEIQRVRKTGFTIVPEAGSQRLRRLIRKVPTNEDIFKSVEDIIGAGWEKLELYFMIGLPTETEEDLQEMTDLCQEILRRARALGRVKQIGISASPFVPKPATPYQWCGQDPIETIREKQAFLASRLRNRVFCLGRQDPEMSFLEAVFSRGDRRLGPVIQEAHRRGCTFDGWDEHFSFTSWLEAFEAVGLDPVWYANRVIPLDETLPWAHIHMGYQAQFLKQEYRHTVGAPLLEPGEERAERPKVDIQRVKKRIPDRPPAKREQPPLSVQRLRVRFAKEGLLRYLSHLELARAIKRAVRRAELPVAYSQGFNPKPKISFGPALPVGVASQWEVFDLELIKLVKPSHVLERLRAVLPEGLRVIEVAGVPLKAPRPDESVASQTFQVAGRAAAFLPPDGVPAHKAHRRRFDDFLAQEAIPFIRHKGRRAQEINLRAFIREARVVDAEDDWLMVELDMPFSRAGSARPHEVMETCYGLEGEELAGLEVEKVAVAWRDSKELG
ncbi:MAG: TIGR03960 family B12-binding radical SAM protein [Nitrospinae bacterium]|nr:TIGR03960 family B12-binding radical SAM protein [Nitrospinota bacterium]